MLRSVAGESLSSRIHANGFGGTYLADTVRFEPRTLALFAQPTVERNRLVETTWRSLAFLRAINVGGRVAFSRAALEPVVTGSRLEKALGVRARFRNMNTVLRIVALCAPSPLS